MSLKDRAAELDKNNDFFARADRFIEETASLHIRLIESWIKEGKYKNIVVKEDIDILKSISTK